MLAVRVMMDEALKVKDAEMAALTMEYMKTIEELNLKYDVAMAAAAENLRLEKARAAEQMQELRAEWQMKLTAKELELQEEAKIVEQMLAEKTAQMKEAIEKAQADCARKIEKLESIIEHLQVDLKHERELVAETKIAEKAAADRRVAAVEERMAAALLATKEQADAQLAATIRAYDAKLEKAALLAAKEQADAQLA